MLFLYGALAQRKGGIPLQFPGPRSPRNALAPTIYVAADALGLAAEKPKRKRIWPPRCNKRTRIPKYRVEGELSDAHNRPAARQPLACSLS